MLEVGGFVCTRMLLFPWLCRFRVGLCLLLWCWKVGGWSMACGRWGSGILDLDFYHSICFFLYVFFDCRTHDECG